MRPAAAGELNSALGLILGAGGWPADPAQVLGFLSYALHRGIDLTHLQVVESAGRLVWAMLPLPSPGRTVLLLAPAHLPAVLKDTRHAELVSRALEPFARRGVTMAQVLLEPHERGAAEFYAAAGFQTLAELVYLDRPLTGRCRTSEPALPAGYWWDGYSDQTHADFGRAIHDSYHDSLDCPALNGMRTIEDTLAGHMGAGEFDPSLWFLLREGAAGTPRGVVLLARQGAGSGDATDATELVYLGLAPDARGRGLGAAAVCRALVASARAGAARITLAVDARNAPALRLYHRHGLRRLCSRLALVKDLRATRFSDAPAPDDVAAPIR